MARLARNARFEFIGELKFGKDIVATRQLGETKWKSTRANVMVKDNENAQFLNIEYIHADDVKIAKIFTNEKDENGKNISVDIDLSMTNSPDVVKNSADYMKTIIDLETDFEKKKEYTKLIFKRLNHQFKKDDEKTQEDFEKIAEYTKQIEEQADNRYEFVHMKDVIKFLEDNKELLDGKKVKVRGNVKTNYYKGNTTLQYVPNEIEFVDEDVPNGLKADVDFFFDKDSMDDDKKGKKVHINGYIMDRVDKQDKLLPLTVVIDYTKIDLDNPEHAMLLDFLKGIFTVKDKKQIHKMGILLSVVNGREVEEFDESKLTDQQKMSIKLGMNKIEDFKKTVYGEVTRELKVINGDFKNYPEGCVVMFPITEIDNYLVQSTEKINEQKEEEKQTETITEADKIANLFG